MRWIVAALVTLGTAHAQRKDVERPEDSWSLVIPTATSTLDDEHAPTRTLDGDKKTAWCEGKGGDGLGESVTFTFSAPHQVDWMAVYAGDYVLDYGPPSPESNRPTKLKVTIDGRPRTLKLDRRGFGEIKLKRTVRSVTLGFAAVKRGKQRASCIGSVVFGPYGPVAVSTPAIGERLRGDFDAVRTALGACDEAAIGEALAFPFDSFIDGKTTYASAADLAKAGCPLPPFFGNAHAAGGCYTHEPDELLCSTREGADVREWTLRWIDDRWRLVKVMKF